MKTIGNIIWILAGGAANTALWYLIGIFWHITVIGIPLGQQCFKLGRLTFSPFTKELEMDDKEIAVSTVANVFWAIFTGIPMAIENFLIGVLFCITIIGIPFGKQYFKLARLSLAPFGVEVVKK